MRIHNIAATVILLISGAFGTAFGQTQEAPVKSPVVAGEVVSLSDKKIVVNTKSGQVEVTISDKTIYKRVSADKPDFQTATVAAFSDIIVGDKLTVTGILAADGRPTPARTVYLMTKADITQKLTKQAEGWRARGIAGKVASLNVATNQITVEVPGPTGKTATTVTLKDGARILRYSAESVKFSDAKASEFSEIKVGDQINALGDKGVGGTTLLAEAIVTGTFLQMSGTVKFVDTAKNEVVIKDSKGKEITVGLDGAIMLKRFPVEMAERMAMFQMARGNGGVRPPNSENSQPSQGQQGQGRGMMGGGSRGGGTDEILERLPNITVSDLRPGEQIGLLILVSNPTPLVGDHIKAIKLIAGIEPFIRMQAASPGANRGQGVQGGFTIPGLDGVGF